jgi:hypothetical protein
MIEPRAARLGPLAVLLIFGTLLVGFLLGVAFQRLAGTEAPVSPAARSEGAQRAPVAGLPEDLHGTLSLFVLAGQSNMSGRADLPTSQETHPRVYMFGNDYRWKPAREPVDDPESQVDLVSEDTRGDPAGFGPSLSFGLALARHRGDLAIGLIPCAKGDTTIAQWHRSLADTTLYGSCLKRVRAASPQGVVSGLLFFQGEADALDPARNPERDLAPAEWSARFGAVVDGFRADLGLASLPVVYAQIGTQTAPVAFVNWAAIQEQQMAFARPCAAMIVTGDLALEDTVHFTAESYQVIGRRFADAYLGLTGDGQCR